MANDRTKQWRLRVKLHETEPEASTSNSNPFSSRQSEYRAVRKVKGRLPETPRRRAHVLKRLAESPRTSQLFTTGGILSSPEARRKLNLRNAGLEALKETKHSGTTMTQKHQAYTSLKQVLLGRAAKKYRLNKTFGQLPEC